MFHPPRCVNPDCDAHTNPQACEGKFFVRNGSYSAKCRSQPIPRFKCKLCNKGFSRQTFRMDYCDNKPYLNGLTFRWLASGMGLRQTARVIGLSRRCLELKVRKISRHLGRLNRNLTGQFPTGSSFSLDEMETFEGERSVLPVTVPVMIETDSMYVVATDVAPIKPSGRMSKDRRKAIAKAESKNGPRKDTSINALERTFRRLRWFAPQNGEFILTTDKKHAYGRLLRKYFGRGVPHIRVSSKLPRDQRNPLRHINLTNAMARDLNGRLRRESWLVSKQRRFLRIQLYIFCAFRNFIRRRINRIDETPAQRLGFLPRGVQFEELLTWRQDWKNNSIHPIARREESVSAFQSRRAA